MDLAPIIILSLAFVSDLFLGDPKWLPHLIAGYGKLIALGEKIFRKGPQDSPRGFLLAKGGMLTVILVAGTFLLANWSLELLEQQAGMPLYVAASSMLLFYCLANKSLIEEGKAVFEHLREGGLEAGRKRLRRIVGRDTQNLNEQQIRTATLETMSENLSDGVIAPLFYYALLGVPGAMAYKMINTLDSMLGYKSEKYLYFGRAAARLDDLANFIPARLTALLMLLVAGPVPPEAVKASGVRFVCKEGKKHSSPNAGYPQAALAYILCCRFGGPNDYGGKRVDKPFIGYGTRQIEHHQINRAAKINNSVSILAALLIIVGFAIAGN